VYSGSRYSSRRRLSSAWVAETRRASADGEAWGALCDDDVGAWTGLSALVSMGLTSRRSVCRELSLEMAGVLIKIHDSVSSRIGWPADACAVFEVLWSEC
jgi:hypothetical protein